MSKIQKPSSGQSVPGTDYTPEELAALRTALDVPTNESVEPYYDADLYNVKEGVVDGNNRVVVTSGEYDSLLYNNKTFSWNMVNALLFYGQSLSEGAYCQPSISVAQPYQNLTFVGYPRGRATASAADLASFIPLREFDEGISPALTGETPCSGMANNFSRLLQSENGLNPNDYQFFASTAGRGGQSIGVLGNLGGADWTRVITQMKAAYDLSVAQGKDFQIVAFNWFQGESDQNTTSTTYATLLNRMVVAFQRFASMLTGKDYTVPCVCFQVSDQLANPVTPARGYFGGLNIARAADPNIYISFPKYAFSNTLNGNALMNGDDVHFSSIGSMLAGAKQAEIVKRITVDGKRSWRPVEMDKIEVQGAIAFITFNVPYGPLVIDTTLMPAMTGNGFKLTDTSGALTISSVDVVNGNRVRIVCNRAIVGTLTVNYGMDYNYTGYTTSNAGAGNLRDSDPFGVNYDDGGGSDFYPLYNWAISQIMSITLN